MTRFPDGREPFWAERDRPGATLNRFFAEALPPAHRRAAYVAMWAFTQSLPTHRPSAQIVYDKSDVLRHVDDTLAETRRAEFCCQGSAARWLLRGTRWPLLRVWGNLDWVDRQELVDLLVFNRWLAEAPLFKVTVPCGKVQVMPGTAGGSG